MLISRPEAHRHDDLFVEPKAVLVNTRDVGKRRRGRGARGGCFVAIVDEGCLSPRDVGRSRG